jgi:23S rRNA (cytosine1962-C5)-methyltransferase
MLELNGTVVVRGKVARQAWRASPWLRAEDVLSRDAQAGPFVDLVDENALPLGTGLLGASPERAVRLVTSARTRDPLLLLQTRLERADARRRQDLLGADAYRLCHGDADGVVGLFVDRFGDGLALHTDGPEVEPLVEPLTSALIRLTGATSVSHWPSDGTAPTLLVGEERNVRFHHGRLLLTLDLLGVRSLFAVTGQLDHQRYLRRWARGRVLDAYASWGGYGLQLADAGAREVVVVDGDAGCVRSIEEDARRNGIEDRIRTVHEDPAEHLRRLEEASERFDCVVLHPPTREDPASAADDAARAALDLHRRALRLLDEGGLLVTAPASSALSDEAFETALAEAALKSRKRLQVLARLGAGADHPALLGMPRRGARDTLVARVVAMA